jgi:predicted porin
VSYTTPNLSGFGAMFLYSTGLENNSATTSAKDGRAWSANATYANGPLWAGIGYENVYTAVGAATTGIEPESKNWIGGASYDFGVVKPIVSYERAKDHDATNTTISDVRVWVVGATAPVGPGRLAVVYANLHDSLHNSADAKQYGVSYSYPLSKRTDVYAAAARISNDSNAAYLIGSGNATLEFLNGSPTGVGVSPKAYEVGFRHSF